MSYKGLKADLIKQLLEAVGEGAEGREPGGSLETSSHLLECRVYQDLREGSDVEGVVEDRVKYLRKVIQRRTALEKYL